MPSPDISYRGHLIRTNPLTGDVWIETGGSPIAYVQDVESGKAAIDTILGPPERKREIVVRLHDPASDEHFREVRFFADEVFGVFFPTRVGEVRVSLRAPHSCSTGRPEDRLVNVRTDHTLKVIPEGANSVIIEPTL